jgi:hypothetical protein
MATTIIAQPQVLMPAYNPIKYIIDNADKNDPGFRYIFTIYPAGSATQIAQYKTLPVYGTGYGEQDISKLMQSLVTWNYDAGQVNESWYQYDIEFGYEFTSNIIYTNSLVQSGGGDVEIQYTAHGFVLGDQISITQAAGGIAANPTVEGLHTVVYAEANLFVINARWDTVTNDTINGTVTYADLRKTQVLDDEIIEDQEVFNGAFSSGIYAQGEFPSASYLGTTDPSYALTSLSNPANPSSATNAAAFVEYFTDSYFIMCRVYSGVTYTVSYYNTASDALIFSPFLVNSQSDGLYNFNVTWLNTMTQDFYVEITGDNGSVFRYYFQYDTRCLINYDVLHYLDRMGSWQSFNFQLKTYEKGQITREMYNQHVDGYVDGANEWVYNPDAIGNRTLNTNVSNTLELNTNWMDQYNADRFQELLTSPQVFYSNGIDTRACTIEATSFENFRQRNKNLIKQSVTIKLALNTPING